MMKRFVLAIATAAAMFAAPHSALAQPEGMPPSVDTFAPAEPDAIPLYGTETPGSPDSEVWMQMGPTQRAVRNVTYPTLTSVLPDPEKATGAAVIVAPGGAFMLLAMDHEGWEVARALADRGIAAFVLKYRLLPTPADTGDALRQLGELMAQRPADPLAPPPLSNPQTTQDGLAALAMVRARSQEWGVDPQRVGMIGFSAGAMTVLNTALAAQGEQAPDFLGYVYGPQSSVEVPGNAPPMFVAIALDDPLFPSTGFPIVSDWHEAGVPVELHAYGRGGHGFGLGTEGTTTTGLLDQFVLWLGSEGLLAEGGAE